MGPLISLFWTWWHFSWVSKLPSLACFVAYVQQNPQVHLWGDTCRPLGSLAVIIQVLANKHWWGSRLKPSLFELRKGIVFTSVCQEFCPQGDGCPSPGPGGYLNGGVSKPRPGGCQGPGPGGCIPACTKADTPHTAEPTAADGTHHTGMHSLFYLLFVLKPSLVRSNWG